MSTPSATLSELAPAIDRDAAELLLIEEAAHLDARRWDDWLALYTDDAVFWIPSWADYETLTDDPATQLSLIYYAGRRRLEERIWRLRSGQSPASVPLSRTLHVVSNVRLDPNEPGTVESNIVVHVFQPRSRAVTVNFGLCRHQLRSTPEGCRIAAKKIRLLNDYLPASLDVYTI